MTQNHPLDYAKTLLKNKKLIAKIIGIAIGLFAIYFSLKNINSAQLKEAIKSADPVWFIPVILINFIVIVLKACRWRAIMSPIKRIGLKLMYKVVLIGFMANNILPARLGEAVRIHILGTNALVSRVTTTATLISDRIVEAVSFLVLVAFLVFFANVPKWMHYGLTVSLFVTVIAYTLAIIYSTRFIQNPFFKKFQEGIAPLLHFKIFSYGILTSLVSWAFQLMMIYMTQLAFNIHLPFWSTLLVLIAVNLAIIVPSAPANLGTFELACILAYTYLGLDKGMGLLIGASYHLLQIIPVTLAGGVLTLTSYVPVFKNESLEVPSTLDSV